VAVSWEPFTADHAIERVRISIHFAQSVQPKQISSLASMVEAKRIASGLGPQTINNGDTVEIDASNGEVRLSKQRGWSFSKTTSDGAALEAIILTPQFLVYDTATYDGWATFWHRYEALSSDLRERIQSDVNVRAVSIEYLDRFRFNGPTEAAQPALLVRESIVGMLPGCVGSGRELWHVHRGWFEGNEPHRYLVNQNLDAQTVQDLDGSEVRSLVILTKIERQSISGDLDISTLASDIAAMHALSKRVVCDALVEDMCERVGLVK